MLVVLEGRTRPGPRASTRGQALELEKMGFPH